MLIAPIFKVDYLSKQTESQNTSKIKDVPSNVQKRVTATSKYNIFKTAINRGTELIRSTFLSTSKGTSLCSESIGSDSIAADKSTTRSLTDSHYDESSSESSSSESEASSPDSIQSELMFFKPILREPRTSISTKIIRLPSIRSTSSTSTINTPCPSPFFIPISTQRQSAFSFVATILTDIPEKDELKKPKRSIKRKNSSTENKKSDEKSPKRKKPESNKKDIKDSRKLKSKTEKITPAATTKGVRTRNQSNVQPATKKSTKVNPKAATNNQPNESEYRRVTRSMKN